MTTYSLLGKPRPRGLANAVWQFRLAVAACNISRLTELAACMLVIRNKPAHERRQTNNTAQGFARPQRRPDEISLDPVVLFRGSSDSLRAAMTLIWGYLQLPSFLPRVT